MQNDKLCSEDLACLTQLLKRGYSNQEISKVTKTLIEAKQQGLHDRSQQILSENKIDLTQVTFVDYSKATSHLVDQGIIPIEEISAEEKLLLQLSASHKNAIVFCMAIVVEGYFDQENANKILAEWCRETATNATSFQQFLVDKKLLDPSLINGVMQKCLQLTKLQAGNVKLQNNILQIKVAIPKSFGRYSIRREIARGGMGIVYHAYDPSFEREVALKVLLKGDKASKQETSRFLLEARTANRITHPNIIPIYDLGEENGMPYFCMAYVEGIGLHQLKLPLHYRKAFKILIPIAEALHQAHSEGVIHRDVKPANIILDQDEKPWLTDFGLAKDQQGLQGLTQSGTFLGTPMYMPPEQIDHPESVNNLCDIYALGVVLYQLLSGTQPYKAKTFTALIAQITTREPEPLQNICSDLPEQVIKICKKAMHRKPNKRYQSALQMAEDMAELAQSKPISHQSRLSNTRIKSCNKPRSVAISQNTRLRNKSRNIKAKKRRRQQQTSTYLIWSVTAILSIITIIILVYSNSSDKSTKPIVRKPKPKNQTTKKKPDTKKVDTQPKKTVNPLEVYASALNHYDNGNHDQAIVDLDKLLKTFPAYEDGYRLKGKIFFSLNLYGKALENFNQALLYLPNSAILHSSKAKALKFLRQFDQAIDSYSKALSLKKCGHCFAARGEIYFRHSQDYQKALDDFILTHRKDFRYKNIYFYIHACYYYLDRTDEAIDFLNSEIKKHPNLPDLYIERGIYHRQTTKNYPEAIKNFNKAIELKPNAYNVYCYKADAYGFQGQYKLAIETCNKAIQINSSRADAYYQRGRYYARLGEQQNALRDLEKALTFPSPYRARIQAEISQIQGQ